MSSGGQQGGGGGGGGRGGSSLQQAATGVGSGGGGRGNGNPYNPQNRGGYPPQMQYGVGPPTGPAGLRPMPPGPQPQGGVGVGGYQYPGQAAQQPQQPGGGAGRGGGMYAPGPGGGPPPQTSAAAALSGMAAAHNAAQQQQQQHQQQPPLPYYNPGYPPHPQYGYAPPMQQGYTTAGGGRGGYNQQGVGPPPPRGVVPPAYGMMPGPPPQQMMGPGGMGVGGYVPQYRGSPMQMQGMQQPPQQQPSPRGLPMQQQQQPPTSSLGRAVGGGVTTAPREKKALTITDKHGNVIDITTGKPVPKAETTTTTTTDDANKKDATTTDSNAKVIDDATSKLSSLQLASTKSKQAAGDALRRAAEEAIAAGSAKKLKEEQEARAREEARKKAELEQLAYQQKQKEEEERLAKEAELKARQEEERRQREEQERMERERLAQEEAKARKEAEERARKEFEDRRRKEEEERAERERLEEEARAKLGMPSKAESSSSPPPGFAAAAAPAAASSAEPTMKSPSSSGNSSIIPPAPSSGGFRPGGFRPGGFRPGGGAAGALSTGGLRPGMSSSALSSSRQPPTGSTDAGSNGARPAAVGGGGGAGSSSNRTPIIYSKQMLLSLREDEYCLCRPANLPDMVVKSGGAGGGGGMGRRQSSSRNRGGGGGGGGGGGSDWDRGNQMPRDNNRGGKGGGGGGGGRGGDMGGASDWQRGKAPPPPRPVPGRGGRGGRGGRSNEPFPDDDFDPLVRNANRWVPSKDNSVMANVEKQVKGLLNKITKEKFDRLAGQLCDIQIKSYDMLTLMIRLVYEKAIGEPSFSDMYANLCYQLSQRVKKSPFIQIIESDEDPMAEPGAEYNYDEGGSATFRWSNDVSTSDAEIIGPFESEEQCIDVALDGEDMDPVQRGEMELSLHRLLIKRGYFIKIMLSQSDGKFYMVCFPLSQAEECGQQLSTKIFTSEIECQNDATKMNTFKRSLLNKCEDEFNKQDIYKDWKEEMKEYKKQKATLSESEQAEREEELEFRRMKIKKQMLGNIKFIGELYKLGMLKEKIMRFCIQSLLKLEEVEGSDYLKFKTVEDDEMDEEDHEALCNLFITIGQTFDNPKAAPYMQAYFQKIYTLSEDKSLSSRSRFAYQDLIDMRNMGWKLRRKVETAKTLEEIRKEAEREERLQQQQSQQGNYGGRGGGGGGGGRGRGGGRGDSYTGGRGDGGGYRGRGDYRNDNRDSGGRRDGRGYDQYDSRGGRGSRNDRSDGRGSGPGSYGYSPNRGPPPMPSSRMAPPPVAAKILSSAGQGGRSGGEVFSKDKIESRAKNMRDEFMNEGRDEKELLLTMDENLGGNADAGKIIVQLYADLAMDCKEPEREAMIEILVILYKAGKLTKSDIEVPMADMVEFVDSFAIDSPGAFGFLGEMLAPFFEMKVLDIKWLCENTAKLMKKDDQKEVIQEAIVETKKACGDGVARALFGGPNEVKALEQLIGAGEFQAIAAKCL